MKDGFKVFDSDMHVLEPVDLWERYIDPGYRHRAPRGSTHSPMDVGVVVDGANAFRLSARIAGVSFKEGLARFAEDIERGFDEGVGAGSVECEEWPVRQAVEACGADRFVFSTDYPHYDTKYPEATAYFLKIGLDERSKRQILWDNCAELYGFPAD